MTWIDAGEFGRGGAAREEARADREQGVLNELLAAGWSRATAADARALHQTVAQAVTRWMAGDGAGTCNEAALGLVGEARGQALAGWWAAARELDDETRRLLVECAGAAAAMAMLDGYLLGRHECREQATSAVPTVTNPAERATPAIIAEPVGMRVTANVR